MKAPGFPDTGHGFSAVFAAETINAALKVFDSLT